MYQVHASPPRAVVFDLDGVLVDSEHIWAASEQATVESLGGAYGPEIAELLYGRGHVDGGRLLAERFGGDPAAVGDELLARALAGFRAGVEPRPGARELVSSLLDALPVAIASNSARAIVEAALAGAGFDGGFAAIVCGDEVARQKPAPDVYLAACRALGLPPADVVAIEDSPVGVASAKAAGLRVIGVPSLPGVELPEADRTAPSLVGLDLGLGLPL